MLENLDLSRSQPLFPHMFSELSGDLRRNALLARMRLANDFDKLFRRRRLEQITTCTSLERALDLHVTFERRKHHKACVRAFCTDRNQRVDAADVRQP